MHFIAKLMNFVNPVLLVVHFCTRCHLC